MWGVGRQIKEKLERKKFKTALDLKNANDEWILKTFSVVLARTVNELRGISCIPLEMMPNPKKGIMTSRSFGHLVEDYDQLSEAVASYAARTGEKLRGEGLTARLLSVFIKTNRFRKGEPQYQGHQTLALTCATNYTPELINAALHGLKAIYRPDYRYHKAGVMVTELELASLYQPSLFDQHNREALTQLMKTVDGINRDDGQGLIRFGAEGIAKRWRMKQEYKSQCYTTRFDELRLIQ